MTKAIWKGIRSRFYFGMGISTAYGIQRAEPFEIPLAMGLDSYHKKLIEAWCLEKTHTVLQARFRAMLSRFDYAHAPVLGIRDMKKRWGSFLNEEKIVLNPKLIHTPKTCIYPFQNETQLPNRSGHI